MIVNSRIRHFDSDFPHFWGHFCFAHYHPERNVIMKDAPNSLRLHLLGSATRRARFASAIFKWCAPVDWNQTLCLKP